MTPAKTILPYDEAERQATLPEHPLSALEAATFIEGMAAELRLMARAVKLDTLSYFLEMARIEASAQIEIIAERELAS
ncbi:hypothetical protein [Bosea minatitlanensis]|uniref:Uncharacterized protein n=1 Tax=Bosea minatitlanensis TaxID=128782 RepID=A0ABW0FA49_9HYPH|nr:hypothetical protein [Bosea minatitlanensis]MCT4495526.1 hypothetical protein [Bosea minatitlanensis]